MCPPNRQQLTLAYFDRAMRAAPDNASIEANMEMARALSGDLDWAEKEARQAAGKPGADARVRQVYAMILSMRRKDQGAAKVYADDLSAEDADRNVKMMRKIRGRA